MADKKISQLTALSAANLAPSTDVLAIVDTSATETKKIVAQDLINGVLNVASAVGIGTASPTARLHVTGSAAGAYGAVIYNTSATGEGLTVRGGSTSSQNALVVQTSSGGDLFTVRSDGNVGIGTASPGAKLHVLGSNFVGIFAGTNANTVYTEYRYNSTTTSGFIGNGSSVLSAAADSDFIVRSEGALKFATNGNNFRAVIDTSGNLGIGTSSPATKLEVYGDGTIKNSGAPSLNIYRDVSLDVFTNEGWLNFGGRFNSTTYATGARIGAITEGSAWSASNYGSALFFSTTPSGSTTLTERARITSGGDFELGTNAGTGTRTLTIQTNTSGDPTLVLTAAGSDGGSLWYGRADTRLYARSSNTGGVYLAAGGTSWTAVSDERKKDFIEPISNAAEKVGSLRAVIGKYKTDADDKRRSFLIAQDVQSVFPEAVDSSTPDQLGLSYSDMIPLLVKAIQELKAELDATKAKVAALEAK